MRGRVSLRAGDRDIDLRLTTNVLCLIEERSGRPVADLFAGFGGAMRISDLRLIVAAAAGTETEDEAGDLIDAAGFAETVAALSKAVAAAFPESEIAAEKVTAAV